MDYDVTITFSVKMYGQANRGKQINKRPGTYRERQYDHQLSDDIQSGRQIGS